METIVVPTPAQMATAARGDGCTRSDSEAVEATGTRAPGKATATTPTQLFKPPVPLHVANNLP